MKYFEVFLLVVYSSSVLSDGDSLLRSCEIKDIDCLSKSTEQFLEKTCKGIPAYDIKAIDPLLIPSLDFSLSEDGGVSLHFKNVTIMGLRNQKISDFQMDKSTKSVVLKLNVDLNIVGDITIELPKRFKSFTGKYTAKASTLATADYGYDLNNDDKGVQHFEVLPENISCQIVNEPEVSLGEDLIQELDKVKNIERNRTGGVFGTTGLITIFKQSQISKIPKQGFSVPWQLNDPKAKEWKANYNSKRKDLQEKTICKLVENAYVTIVHNIRAAAKVLPANAFFKDI